MFFNNIKKNIKIYLIFVVLLFPLVFGFINTDLSIYLKAGKTILDGGKLYVDFIDVKPPIFFTSYAVVNFFINDNYRLFFVLLFAVSLATTVGIFHFVQKQFNREIGIYTSISYSLIIATIGHSMGMHFEVLFNFLIFLSVLLHYKTKDYYANEGKPTKIINLILFGVLLSYIFSSKYTYGLLSAAFLFYDWGSGNYKFVNLLKKYLIIGTSFVIATVLFHFWLFDSEILAAYKDLLEYMKFYSSMPPTSATLVRDMIKNTGIFFGDNLSILISFATFLGIYSLADKSVNKNQKYLVLVNVFIFIFLLLSVIIEKKLIIYHFARLSFPVALLSGIGINYAIDFIKKYWKEQSNFSAKFAITALIFLMLLLSPLSRYAGLVRHSIAFFKPDADYYKFLDSNRPIYFNYYEKYQLANYINSNYSKDTKVLISSIGSFDLIYQLNTLVFTQLPQRCNYLSEMDFPNQLAQFADLMDKTDLLIIQRNDKFYPILTGSDKSSEQKIKENPITNRLLNEKFDLVKETDAFLLYQAKNFVN